MSLLDSISTKSHFNCFPNPINPTDFHSLFSMFPNCNTIPKLLPFQSFLLILPSVSGKNLVTIAEYSIQSVTEKRGEKQAVEGKLSSISLRRNRAVEALGKD